MIIFEYLFWILCIGFCNFVAIRLMWLYAQVEGHLFWQKTNATIYYIGATLLLVAMIFILVRNFHITYLLILLLGEYALIAGAAVKVSDRGIMANAFMARWPDILQAKRIGMKREIILVTIRSWQRMRFQVPADKEAAFRKMLAAKAIAIVEEEIAQPQPGPAASHPIPQADQMEQHDTTEGVALENLS